MMSTTNLSSVPSLTNASVHFRRRQSETPPSNVQFFIHRLADDEKNKKSCLRVTISPCGQQNLFNFYIHYRVKGSQNWESSPLIRQSSSIDIHGLERNCVYQIRVAVLSEMQEVNTNVITITHRDSLQLPSTRNSFIDKDNGYYRGSQSQLAFLDACEKVANQVVVKSKREAFEYFVKYF